MTVVLLERGDVVEARGAGAWSRAKLRVLGRRWDRELARGVSPDASVEHSLRATWLASAAQRQVTARALERMLQEVRTPSRHTKVAAQPMSGATRSAVLGSAFELTRLADRLASSDPVSPRGLALARLLTTDGGGPLHYGTGADELRRVCAGIQDALDPEWTPS